MLFKDAYKSYDNNNVAYLVLSDGEPYAISNVNTDGGTCGCCREIYNPSDCVVLRVVDMLTGETLYKDETQ